MQKGIQNVYLCITKGTTDTDLVSSAYCGSARVRGGCGRTVDIPDLEIGQHCNGTVDQLLTQLLTAEQKIREVFMCLSGLPGLHRVQHGLPQRRHAVESDLGPRTKCRE